MVFVPRSHPRCLIFQNLIIEIPFLNITGEACAPKKLNILKNIDMTLDALMHI